MYYVCMYVCTYAYIYGYVNVHVHMYDLACRYVCTRVCMYLCMYDPRVCMLAFFIPALQTSSINPWRLRLFQKSQYPILCVCKWEYVDPTYKVFWFRAHTFCSCMHMRDIMSCNNIWSARFDSLTSALRRETAPFDTKSLTPFKDEKRPRASAVCHGWTCVIPAQASSPSWASILYFAFPTLEMYRGCRRAKQYFNNGRVSESS